MKNKKAFIIVVICILLVLILLAMFLWAFPKLINNKGSINEDTYEQFTEFETELLDIEYEYLNDEGYVDKKDIEKLLDSVEGKIKEHWTDEIIREYSRENDSVYIKFKSGISYLFIPYQKDALSNGDGAKIGTFAPVDSKYSTSVSRIRADIDKYFNNLPYKDSISVSGNAEYITKSLPNKYNYQSALLPYNINTDFKGNAYDFRDNNVTVESLKKLSNYQIVIFEGHGGFTEKLGSVLCTGESFVGWQELSKYKDDIEADRVLLTSFPTIGDSGIVYSPVRQYGVTSKFFDYYLGEMNDSVVFVGACNSGRNNILARSFINKGAKCFVGYTDVTSMEYEMLSRSVFFFYMTQNDMNVEEAFNATISTKGLGKDYNEGYNSEITCFIKDKQLGANLNTKSKTESSNTISSTEIKKSTEKPTEPPTELQLNEWQQLYVDLINGSDQYSDFALIQVTGGNIPNLLYIDNSTNSRKFAMIFEDYDPSAPMQLQVTDIGECGLYPSDDVFLYQEQNLSFCYSAYTNKNANERVYQIGGKPVILFDGSYVDGFNFQVNGTEVEQATYQTMLKRSFDFDTAKRVTEYKGKAEILEEIMSY